VDAGIAPLSVAVGPRSAPWAPGMMSLLASHAPDIPAASDLRETLTLTATSIVSPEVWASTACYALGPAYRLEEEGEGYVGWLPVILSAGQ